MSGSYTNATRQFTCQPCPERYFCTPVNLTADPYSSYKPCPKGFFCPISTGLNWRPCPLGTYSNKSGLASEAECTDCDGGMYCSQLNSTAPTGICAGGFYCTSGVDRPNPISNVSATNCSQAHTGN